MGTVPLSRAARAALLDLASGFVPADRVRHDPLGVVRRAAPADREVVAHIAAALAYGAVGVMVPAIERVVTSLRPSPSVALDSWSRGAFVAADPRFVYRMTRADDIDAFLTGLATLRAQHGTLGRAFAAGDDGAGDVVAALTRYVAALRAAAGSDARGLAYLAPDPALGSATKRWHLLLRWLVRPDDGADLGLWPEVGTHRLLLPLDTHTARLTRALGLTQRATVDLAMAREVTARLRALDPVDPIRFDMPLCHLGIAGACRHQWDASVCPGCPLRGACAWTVGHRRQRAGSRRR
ncbi:MAG: TIGR02757 family protein [Myxococcales bacterium]|nr:TIGR02757 family protein [Myxococcales bacterium]MCB9520022.1 TIGR02757 family protein [Myxococcales bacterium]